MHRLLTAKYLGEIPHDSRAAANESFDRAFLTTEVLEQVAALSEIAGRRGQTLAPLAITWVLRDPRVTTALIGASKWEQIAELLAALEGPPLTDAELAEIDRHAEDAGINLWAASSDAG